jgi:hypothetical protein
VLRSILPLFPRLRNALYYSHSHHHYHGWVLAEASDPCAGQTDGHQPGWTRYRACWPVRYASGII